MPKVIVYHGFYGCDTGCCGHVVEIHDDNGKILRNSFDFNHPDKKEEYLEFAKEVIRNNFGEEHIKDLDWENCEISTD